MKRLFLVVLILLLSSFVYAESFTATVTPIKDKVYADELAEFAVTVQNLDTSSDRFTIYTPDTQWRVFFEGSILRLGPKEKKTITLLLDPANNIDAGKVYTVPLFVRSLNDDEQIELREAVAVDKSDSRQYRPSIFTDVQIGDEGLIDPTKPFDVKIRFINKNPLDVKSLKVQLSSSLFTDEFETQLGPNEQVTKILTYSLNAQTVPQDFFVDIYLSANNGTATLAKRVDAKVTASTAGFTRTTQPVVDEFLKHVYSVQLYNGGNVDATETVELESTLIQRLFTHSNVNAHYEKKDGKYYAVFDVTLAPGTGLELTVEKNYRPFVFTTVGLLAAILIVVALYFMLRAPVIVTKRIDVLEQEEDGVSKLKVILNVKNRSTKTLENVKILERTPNITEVERDFAVGTLKPTKIVSNQLKGTLVRWDFPTLEAYEERIITYKIRSKLSILGTLSLPATIVKYDGLMGQKTVTESDAISTEDSE